MLSLEAKEKRLAYTREWHKKKNEDPDHRKQRRNKHLLRNYGISLDDYYLLLAEQSGQCRICGTTDPGGIKNKYGDVWFHVDHCHDTGEVRGLLCQLCNTALGMLKHDPDLLRRAADYLETDGGES